MSDTLDIKLNAYARPYMRPAKYKSLSGGRGSGKSHVFAALAVMRMAGWLPDYKPGPVRIASGREYKVNIPESVKRIVEEYIGKFGLADEFDIRRDWIDHRPTGSHLWFPAFGKDPNAFRSTFKVDVLWIEEAQFLSPYDMEVIAPSIFRDEDEDETDDGTYRDAEIWCSWNPILRTDWAWQRFIKQARQEDVHRHVTWKDNFWFPRGLREERAAMLVDDPEREPHVYGGQPDDGDGSTKVLPYSTLKACVLAWKAGLAPSEKERERFSYAGLDLADGGANKCSLTIRSGPVVEHRDRWPGVTGDLKPAAERAHRNVRASKLPIIRVSFDAATSGMRAELTRVQTAAADGPPYGIRPVGFGDAVGGPDIEYEVGRPNKMVFARLNIQMADALRLRANRTVRLLKGDRSIRPMDCLFIRDDLPDRDTYLEEMSRPIRRVRPDTGKWELEKAPDGQSSPDDFDSTCLAFVRDTLKLKAR